MLAGHDHGARSGTHGLTGTDRWAVCRIPHDDRRHAARRMNQWPVSQRSVEICQELFGFGVAVIWRLSHAFRYNRGNRWGHHAIQPAGIWDRLGRDCMVTAYGVSPRNGSWPVTNLYRVAPRA